MIKNLKKYFTLSCFHKEIPKSELLSSNEALKAFGLIGKEHKADVMMMMAVIEYEYGRNRNYTDVEIAAVKKTLAEVMKFFIGCGEEWKQFEKEIQKRQLENQ